MEARKVYHTNCSESQSVEAMMDASTSISRDEFLTEVGILPLLNWYKEKFPWPAEDMDIDAFLNDPCVSFGKGIFEGKECVYLQHSAVEFVFV